MPILSRQFRQFPTSGNIMTSDANPLSSRIGYDMVQGVNNLHYTMPWIAYTAAPTTDGTHNGIVAGDMTLDNIETFAAQFPTVIPDGMKRFCWTMGFYASYLEDGLVQRDFTINAINVYVSPNIYTGSIGGLQAPTVLTAYAFDVSVLGGNYGLSPYTTPITFTNLDDSPEVYTFVDMSAGTTGAIVPFNTKVLDGALNAVNIIVTFTVDREAGAVGELTFRLASFTSWFLME